MRVMGYDIGVVEALIIINVMVFMITLATDDMQHPCGPYINWVECTFGLIPFIALTEPWRLITSMFVHGGFNHLLYNLLTLFFLGTFLCSLIGEKKFLRLYFAGGILGGIFVVVSGFLFGTLNMITIGASGAIFAVGGALAILKPNQPVLLFFIIPMPMWIAIFGVFLLLSFLPGVSLPGHLGGLVVGVILGYRFKKKEPLTGHLYGSYEYSY
ncbi:MAG: rhomboid family intramembrane serine protease [Candidatus Altiarchaeota archaeon]|nr:rhomboid family intramembrane serine protease [Candidatus Altiarchaeota archaeon]